MSGILLRENRYISGGWSSKLLPHSLYMSSLGAHQKERIVLQMLKVIHARLVSWRWWVSW